MLYHKVSSDDLPTVIRSQVFIFTTINLHKVVWIQVINNDKIYFIL